MHISQHLFPETYSAKKRGHISDYKRGYQYAPLASFSESTSDIYTDTHSGEKIYFQPLNEKNITPTKLWSSLSVSLRDISYFALK